MSDQIDLARRRVEAELDRVGADLPLDQWRELLLQLIDDMKIRIEAVDEDREASR